MTSITLNQMQYVLALAKAGSFSKAAEGSYVTQSTLSTMIKKLEQQIDMVLFDRKSKPITATEEGSVIIAQFKILLREYENLQELIQETKQEYCGTFKIGIIPTLAPFLLRLFLDDMIKEYPKVNFSIDEITTNEIIERIKTRELDIGILSLPTKEKTLIEKTLFYEDFLVYDVSKSNNSKKNKVYKVDDIDVNRLWLLEESHCLSNQIGNICQLRGKRQINKNLVYNSGSILSLLELVNVNKGITLLPRLATINDKLINTDHMYRLVSPQPVRCIGLLMHPNFSKRKLQNVLEEKILSAVSPILRKLKNVKIINPY